MARKTLLLLLVLLAIKPPLAKSQSRVDGQQVPGLSQGNSAETGSSLHAAPIQAGAPVLQAGTANSTVRRLPPVETQSYVVQASVQAAPVMPTPLPPQAGHSVGVLPPSPEQIPPGVPAPLGPRPLALSDLEGIALGNNPTLVQASARVQAARSNWVQVGLYPNPTVGYQGVEIGDDGRAGQQGIYLGQEFVRGHKLQLNRNAATQAVRQAEQELEAQRMRVVNDVRISFYNALIAQRRMELADQLIQVGQQGFRATEQLFKGQEGTRIDLLQSRIELNTARIVATNAQNNYQAVWRTLAAALGLPGMAPVQLSGNLEACLPDLTWEQSLQNVLGNSPELAAARAGIEQARWALSRARAEPIPNIDVQFTAQHDNSTADNIVGVQAVLPIPFFNRNQGGIGRAQADFTVAQGEMQRLQLELQQRLAATYLRYANAKQQVDRYSKEILPDARASLDLVTALHSRGESSYLVLLIAQRTYFQTNLAYLDALQELRESSIAIEGLLLTGNLNVSSIPTTPSTGAYGASPVIPGLGR